MSNIFVHKNKTTSAFYIKFYPGIKSSIGCEKATLILGRLEYWFEKYANGFYKFVEPCEHLLYRKGDSWAEEIGFSRKIFAKSFDLIGVRYKSKSAFNQAKDKFHGKLYASYHDRKTNQTYFIRNHQFASDFIKGLFNRKQTVAPQKPKTVEANEDKKIGSFETPSSPKKGRSRNGQKCRSSGGTTGGKGNKPIQKNTSSLKHDNPKSQSSCLSPAQTKMTEGMIKIWAEEIGELGISFVSNRLLSSLSESLKHFFEQSLDQWRSYCRMIASSKFLMGEAQNKFFKKAWITWAIKEEAIERIRGGGFMLGDRETVLDTILTENTRNLDELNKRRCNLEERIDSIKSSIKEKRAKTIKERVENLSQTEYDQFKKEYENLLKIEKSPISTEFEKNGWNGLMVEAYFYGFLREKLENDLFNTSFEDEADKTIEASGFLMELAQIHKSILSLKENHSNLKEQ